MRDRQTPSSCREIRNNGHTDRFEVGIGANGINGINGFSENDLIAVSAGFFRASENPCYASLARSDIPSEGALVPYFISVYCEVGMASVGRYANIGRFSTVHDLRAQSFSFAAALPFV
jgi:hypothetical protein